MNDPGLEAAVRAAEARFYDALRRLHTDETALADLLACWSRADATTMNARGGHETGWEAIAGRWTWWAGQHIPMPAHRVEPLSLVVTPAMACTVALEDHGDRTLRVTHVYRLEHGDWKLVHRHADPLSGRQG